MNDIETNPYAAPSSDGLPAIDPKSATGYFYRDGAFLVVSNKAELPFRCVLTNQPVENNGWRKSVAIAWTPPWVFITLLAGFLVALILILVMQKKAKMTYCLSPEGRGRIRKKKMIGGLLLVIFAGLIFAGFNMPEGSPLTAASFLGGIVILITSLVFFIIANPIKAVKYRDGWFRVKGCSPEFLDSLPPMPSSPF